MRGEARVRPEAPHDHEGDDDEEDFGDYPRGYAGEEPRAVADYVGISRHFHPG